MAQKASDRAALPICCGHHRLHNSSLHTLGPRRFEECYGVMLADLVHWFATKPHIYIHGASFVVLLRGREFYIGPVSNGVEVAVRSALNVWREDTLHNRMVSHA